jgi:prohibitin 2
MNLERIGIIAGMLLALIVFGISSCSSVDTGSVGVVKHFGAVQPYTLPEGINFTRPWPFASVTLVTTQNSTTDTEAAAASKDLQAVHTKVTLQWSIAPGLAPRFLQRFGDCDGCWVGILSPAVQEVVKAVSARYTAEQLITHRAQVKTEIELGLNDFIKKTLSERGVAGAIRIANVAVTNFEFSHDFNASIEAKVKAEQDSLRAENEKKTKITQAEARAREVTLAAEAAAKSTTLSADAEAYSIEAQSKAKAGAIKREADALQANPQLVELRRIERWDGKLPTYTGNSIPMLQLK